MRWDFASRLWFCDAVPLALCFTGAFLARAQRSLFLPWRHDGSLVHLDAANGHRVWRLTAQYGTCGGRPGRWPD